MTESQNMEAAYKNHNELFIPINSQEIFQEHGVKKGTVCYSDTFKSWVIVGHPTIDMICIEPPYAKGDTYTSESGDKGYEFNGMTVSSLVIKHNMWCLSFDQYWDKVNAEYAAADHSEEAIQAYKDKLAGGAPALWN